MREVAQLYEVTMNQRKIIWKGSMDGLSHLPGIISRQLVEGHPVEVMDGDHGIYSYCMDEGSISVSCTYSGTRKENRCTVCCWDSEFREVNTAEYHVWSGNLL